FSNRMRFLRVWCQRSILPWVIGYAAPQDPDRTRKSSLMPFFSRKPPLSALAVLRMDVTIPRPHPLSQCKNSINLSFAPLSQRNKRLDVSSSFSGLTEPERLLPVSVAGVDVRFQSKAVS